MVIWNKRTRIIPLYWMPLFHCQSQWLTRVTRWSIRFWESVYFKLVLGAGLAQGSTPSTIVLCPVGQCTWSHTMGSLPPPLAFMGIKQPYVYTPDSQRALCTSQKAWGLMDNKLPLAPRTSSLGQSLATGDNFALLGTSAHDDEKWCWHF